MLRLSKITGKRPKATSASEGMAASPKRSSRANCQAITAKVSEFGKGLSDPDEPDVLLTDFTDAKRLWVEVGQPDDKPMAKACSKADSVVVYAYDHAADVWWQGVQGKVARLAKLQVWRIPSDLSQALAALAERSMQLQVTIQEGAITISSNLGSVYIEPIRWK